MLITGGTGTFGQAMTRAAVDAGARKVVILSRGEAKQAAMRETFGNDPRLRFLIGDVRDAQRMRMACRGIDTVLHAAALKRIDACEADPDEAVATNVTGTQSVAHACLAAGVERAVFLSTDKAAAPNTLYGATKLTAERSWIASNVYAAGTPTRFSATRYGNVLGSTGSVVPLWQRQATRGEPLTVTDPAMTRFWMPITAAVELVILALRTMRGGEVLIPKVGAAPILTLAAAVAPGHPYRVTGLRRGEKLHETLVAEDEAPNTYDHGTHYVIEPDRTWETDMKPQHDLAPRYPKVPAGFAYRSDTAHPLTADQLRGMLA